MKFVKMIISRHRGVSIVRTMEENMQNNLKRIMILLLTVCLLVACKKEEVGIVALEDVETSAEAEELVEEIPDTIFVYVCGAVVNEGVYELPRGSRSYEAILMAGGFTEIAATTEVDQATILQDEATLYVPNYSEVVEKQEIDDGKVNLNTASKEELMTLPGVGESKASSIVSYRESHGGFQAIEDIMQISGIKEGLFEKIKDYIKI